MHQPNLETWKQGFEIAFRRDWFPKHWITNEEKEAIITKVKACSSWEQVLAVTPYMYVPVAVLKPHLPHPRHVYIPC